MPPENSHPRDIEFAVIEDGSTRITAPLHRYSKLGRPSDFRLLRLQPRSYFHPLETMIGSGWEFSPDAVFASLVNANLEEAAMYDCLSYTWGTQHDGQVVWLDESPVQIGRNLHRALRRLQRRDEPRLVWVDFLCINQQDVEEKEAQVRIMFQIYHGAREVVIDVGDAADGSEQVGELMAQIWDKMIGKQVKLPPNKHPVWEAFRKFLQRPWFRRVWIVQETFAAKKLQIRCGDWFIRGEVFFAIVEFGMVSSLPFLPKHREGFNPWQDKLVLGMQCITLHMDLSWVKRDELEHRGVKWSLIDLLGRSRQYLSTDPRDRVFAFLNLSREANEPALQANYMETVEETYTRVAKFFAVGGQLSRLLCNAGASASTLGLPSWIPDWSPEHLPFDDMALQRTCNLNVWEYAAGGQSVTEATKNAELDDSCKSLKVTGFIIGRITKLGTIHQFREDLLPAGVAYVDTRPDDQLETKAVLTIKAGDGVATFRSRQFDNEVIEKVEPMLRAAEPALETLTKAEWDRLPILFRYASEVLLQVRASDAYGGQDAIELTCRTMVCDRAAGTYYQAPLVEYIRDFEAYFAACLASESASFLEFDVKRFAQKSGCLDFDSGRFVRNLAGQQAAPDLERDSDEFLDLYRNDVLERWKGGFTFERAARRYCFRKRLGCTEQGLVGLVPHETAVDDVLVILKGVSVPMILRSVAGHDHQYTLVGQAFFHGFMYGEVFSMDEYKSTIVTLV